MRPVLFRIGSFPVSSYYVMGMIGVIVGFFLLVREADRLKLSRKVAVNAATAAAIFGYLGARIMHIVFDGFFEVYLQKPIAMLYFWKGGLAFYGAVIFGLLSVVIYLHSVKAPQVKYFDLFSYPLALGVALGRMGCSLNGCCYGEISDSPIAVTFIKYGISAKKQFANDILHNLNHEPYPVVFTQMISFVVNILIFLFMYFVVRKRYKKDGVPFGLWLVLYAIFRFIIEIFRDDDRGLFFNNMLSSSQIIAILLSIVGLLIMFLPAEQGVEKETVEH